VHKVVRGNLEIYLAQNGLGHNFPSYDPRHVETASGMGLGEMGGENG